MGDPVAPAVKHYDEVKWSIRTRDGLAAFFYWNTTVLVIVYIPESYFHTRTELSNCDRDDITHKT